MTSIFKSAKYGFARRNASLRYFTPALAGFSPVTSNRLSKGPIALMALNSSSIWSGVRMVRAIGFEM